VFHQALKNLKRFEWRGVPFAAWLYRIAANAVADHFIRTAREHSGGNRREIESEEPRDIEHAERRATLFRLVDRLPADQRRVLVMRFGQEQSNPRSRLGTQPERERSNNFNGEACRRCGRRWARTMAERDLIERLDNAVEAILAGRDAGLAGLALAEPDLATLLVVADDLRDLPDPRFQSRLKAELIPPAEMP
jgi:hypothetical protein